MTISKEQPFCEVKGRLILFNVLPIAFRVIKSLPNISSDNIKNAITVAKDCWKGKSNSWIINADVQPLPLALTIPMVKRKPSEKTAKLMAEYYQASANDDLALAKEFEGIESEIDMDCSQ
jgi:hypothetical protein